VEKEKEKTDPLKRWLGKNNWTVNGGNQKEKTGAVRGKKSKGDGG